MRRRDSCMNCGEVREMAGYGLCYRCYRAEGRAEDRADDQQFADVDRHSPGVRREHKKLFRGLTGVMVGLSDLGVSRSDVFAIRRIIDPYLAAIAAFLAPETSHDEVESVVNSEQKLRDSSQFTDRQILKQENANKRKQPDESEVTRFGIPLKLKPLRPDPLGAAVTGRIPGNEEKP
jgi:hypothetical protein